MIRAMRMRDALAQRYAEEVDQISLHDLDPGDTGANEVTAVGYVRQSPTGFTVLDGQATFAEVEFTLTDVDVAWAGLWDAAGNFLDAVEAEGTFDDEPGLVRLAVIYTQE